MNTTLKNSTLAWALIFAQLFLITLSQGRMVVCHKANGSSHIELINDLSPDFNEINETNHVLNWSPTPALNGCSDGPCVDELLTVAVSVLRPRHIEIGNHQGFVPPPPLAILWDEHVAPTASRVLASGTDDALPLNDLQRRIGSTVLLL